MPTISLSDTTQYLNLTALSSVAGSLLVTNTSASPLYVVVQSVQPTADTIGVVCESLQEVFINNQALSNVWVKAQRTGSIVVQAAAGASAEYSVVSLPQAMYTSTKEGYSRIRVDSAQTSFFEGREFRSFYELNIPQGQSVTLQVVSPINFILFEQALTLDAGAVRLTAYTGATPAGTFGNVVPVIGKNRMPTRPLPNYTAQISITSGGSVTGGTKVEVVRVVAASATSQHATVGNTISSERGLPAGTYHLVLENLSNGAATGVYTIWWEERP